MAAAVLALLAAACWGVGDFLGGLASRRTRLLTVLAISQLAGLVGVAVWAVLSGDPWPGLDDTAPAAGAGLAGAVGLACLYRGLAIGAMGVVAPISALSPAVPLAVDVVRGESPGGLQWLGIAVALAGVVVLSREPGGGTTGAVRAAGVGLALVAALGFGLFIVGIDAAADASVPWATTTARGSATVLAVAAALRVGHGLRPPRRLLPLIAAVGLFDTSANVLIAQATTLGSAGVVAVLSALYPLATIVLARLVLHERLTLTQRGGAALALLGVVLVVAG